MNKTLLIGRITKDVELRQSKGGVSSVIFSIAVDRDYKDENGEKVTDFINCIAFRNNADFMDKYVKKGNLLGITGSLQTYDYEGTTRYQVVVDSVQNLSPKEKEETKTTKKTTKR